jgi:hypothetical protein
MLDDLASSLESRGFTKEAFEIDLITNALEKEAFLNLNRGKANPQSMTVKINERSTVSASDSSSVRELVSLIEGALRYIGNGARYAYANSMGMPTDKTKKFLDNMKKEYLRVKVSVPHDSLGTATISEWRLGGYYDLSNIYKANDAALSSIANNSEKALGLKGKEILDNTVTKFKLSPAN